MQPRILAIRAISAIYVLEILKPIFIATVGISLSLAAIFLYLSVTWSAWWLIFLVLITLVAIVVIVAMLIALSLANTVAPAMSEQQRTAAKKYVKNIHEVSDTVATPQFIIIFKIILDVIKRRWQGGFIQTTTRNSARLKQDFEELVTLFS